MPRKAPKRASARLRTVRAFAPATVANVACGFDVLGFALDSPGDEVVVTREAEPGIRVRAITGDGGKLPTDPEKNTAAVACSALLRHLGENIGLGIEVHKCMPLGSGLGSSAASAAAGVLALSKLLGCRLSGADLVPFAMEGERAACGAAHADNVAPALVGGFALIRSYEPLDIVQIKSPPKLFASVVHPHIEIQTADARKILRKQIALKDAVVQWGNIAGLIAGLYTGDYKLIGRSMQDVIVEPERSILIPGFDRVKAAAHAAGALGCSISGSGPSVFALSEGAARAKIVGERMSAEFRAVGIECDVHISRVNPKGARILKNGRAR